MREYMRLLQSGLKGLGHDPGALDGLYGRKTEAALRALLAARTAAAASPTDLPWMAEAKRLLGRHEARDNTGLRRWLRSDGRTLGDPARLPWCGDFVETALRLTLVDEPFLGPLGENPYWARHWLYLGREIKPSYGAVMVFSRSGGGGHVGFALGQDESAFHILGGNQSNSVSVARIDRGRLLGARWPLRFAGAPGALPYLAATSKFSINEA